MCKRNLMALFACLAFASCTPPTDNEAAPPSRTPTQTSPSISSLPEGPDTDDACFSRVESDGSVGGTNGSLGDLVGDIDGDGKRDTVYAIAKGHPRPERYGHTRYSTCRYYLVVESGGSKVLSRVWDEVEDGSSASYLDVRMLTPVDDQPGLEVIVTSHLGAAVETYGIYTWRDGGLLRTLAADSAEGWFHSSGSGGASYGLDCVQDSDGALIMSDFVPNDVSIPLQRTYYKLEGSTWELYRNERVSLDRAAISNQERFYQRFPEFLGLLDACAGPLVLEPDGLGMVDVGMSPSEVIARIELVLGAPTWISEWMSPNSEYGVCPGSRIKAAEWLGLHVLFTDGVSAYHDESEPHFFGYQFQTGELGLTTSKGVGIGATVNQLKKAYAHEVEINRGRPVAYRGFLIGSTRDGQLGGSLTKVGSGLRIRSIWGGQWCGE